MKKILYILPLSLLLFACNNDDDYTVENIEIVDPKSEGSSTGDELSDGDDVKVPCGNRWDCTKVAPRTGDDNKDKSSEIIKSTQILNVK